ncbi:sensor histidine kinase [Tepidamorphus sp. 3E244]|uniref:sensor histidine kinase n=1 Tax=Tepidamorphus sp. 3E244 TaxID=3385498 RepID=UPI0038FCD095
MNTKPETAEESALRLAAIVESSDDAIVSKRLDGTITSWNHGAERLFGYTAEEIVGQSILTIIPEDRRHEEEHIIQRISQGERVKHFETYRCRKDGSLVPISVTVSPIKQADGTIIGASKIARDISDRKRAERRLGEQAEQLSILQRISASINADLDLDRIIQTVTDEATALSGAKFGAFFNMRIAEDGQRYMLYSLSGAPREAFESFGMPRKTQVFAPTFEGTHVVRSADIRSDPRYGLNAPHEGMPEGHLPVVSYLAVPVKSSSGEVLGGLFFGHDEPDQFGEQQEQLLKGIASQAAVAIENARLHDAAKQEIERRRVAEETKDLLLHELKHRIKNTMTMIHALASQTLRATPEIDRQAFLQRLHALSGAHDLLTMADWKAVSLHQLAERALRPFRELAGERIAVSGPDALVQSSQALSLTLAFHELATNAVKYGALSAETGTIAIDWRPDDADESHLQVTWSERGGPPVATPKKRGFGSKMIESALRGRHGAVRFDYAPEGIVVTIQLDLQQPAENS